MDLFLRKPFLWGVRPGPKVMKNMLNSAEHEISAAH